MPPLNLYFRPNRFEIFRESAVNKPVILSEDTLAAPIVVDAPATPAAATPAFAVIGAISVSHMLNDLMQSLIPSVYPILKANYALDFGQIGLITLAFMFTSSLLQPVIGAYTDKHPACGCIGRHRLGGVSSGVLAHRADGVGRPRWHGAIGVSGRRQFRQRHRSGAGSADRRAARAGQHRLVLAGGRSCHRDPLADRPLVQAARRAAQEHARCVGR
jgi:hypothetical protein